MEMQDWRSHALPVYKTGEQMSIQVSEISLEEHRQYLLETSREACECTPDSTCRGCRARARVSDPNYEPNVIELAKGNHNV